MSFRLALLTLTAIGLSAQEITVVSAASFQPAVAPDSLATVFGVGLSDSTQSADSTPLPEELSGVTVEINGQRAGLVYISPVQINLWVPRDVATGVAEVVVTSRGTNRIARGEVVVRLTAPGIFTSEGVGVIRNAVTWSTLPFLVETPEIAGEDKRTRLAVFGTGLRLAGNPERDDQKTNVAEWVQARLERDDGRVLNLGVEFAGSVAGYYGLDQLNLVLPPAADGFGVARLIVTADGGVSNDVATLVAALPADAIALRVLQIPAVVTGGESITGTLALNAPARGGGFPVALISSDRTAVPTPSVVTVPAGQWETTFSVRTNSFPTERTVQITASGGGGSRSADIRLRPQGAPTLAGLELSAATVSPGASLRGTVSLAAPAPGQGAVVALASSTSAVQVPATVTVAFGQRDAFFDILASQSASGTATISASLDGVSLERQLEVRPPLSVKLAASTVTGGAELSGTVLLAAPAQSPGLSIQLRSSAPQLARVPASINVPAGATSGSFTVLTANPTRDELVVITAQAGVSTATAQFTVQVDQFGIDEFTITPPGVTGGQSATGTVRVRSSTPVLGLITVLSSNMARARAPLSVFVPRGQSQVQFPIQTTRAPFSEDVEFTVTFYGATRTAKLKVD